MKRTIILLDESRRKLALDAVRTAPVGMAVTVGEPTRTLEQNALLWPLLTEISQQVNWYGQRLTQEEWKDVLTASLKKQKAVPGIDGGFVVCGSSTSKMTKQEFSELLSLAQAFLDEKTAVVG